MVKNYLVLPWTFFVLAFRVFVQCSMFNAGSMLHRLNKANFRLFIALYAVRGFLSIGQVANTCISNGTRPHVDTRERIGDSSVRF